MFDRGVLPADCLILAAGLSVRMKTFKLTLPLAKKTVIERSVENALAACEQVLLVTGHRAEEIEALFSGNERVKIVRNAAYRGGMFTSVRSGAAESRGSACFIVPADLPFISPGLYRLLYLTYLESLGSSAACVPARPASFRPEDGKRRGHPLLVNRAFLDHILAAPSEASLRDLFRRWGAPTPVPWDDPGAYEDLDTEEDYKRLVSGDTF